jgi:hypothetical protein
MQRNLSRSAPLPNRDRKGVGAFALAGHKARPDTMKPRGARTFACRVHTRVNALKIVSATLCSEECDARVRALRGVFNSLKSVAWHPVA